MSIDNLKSIIYPLIDLDSFTGTASMAEIKDDDVGYREVEMEQ